MASKYVLLLSNVTTKICVHMCAQRTLYLYRHQNMFNVNGVKKYGQFPSFVINKMQCDDVNTCHF